VPSRVSKNHVGVITTGGHKILPYDVVGFSTPGNGTPTIQLRFSQLTTHNSQLVNNSRQNTRFVRQRCVRRGGGVDPDE
jgi:hypothetical protein